MGSISIWHWVIVLLVVAMVFGTKKLRHIGTDLGSAIRGFKEGLQEGQEGKERKGTTPNESVTLESSAELNSTHSTSSQSKKPVHADSSSMPR